LAAYDITAHAARMMKRRGISEELVRSALSSPGQVLEVSAGRKVFQSRIRKSPGEREHVLRVFVDASHDPPKVITVYRTSKVSKYWREET
jgi:hypothetical protein